MVLEVIESAPVETDRRETNKKSKSSQQNIIRLSMRMIVVSFRIRLNSRLSKGIQRRYHQVEIWTPKSSVNIREEK